MVDQVQERSWVHYTITPTTEINSFRENLFAFLAIPVKNVFPKIKAKNKFFEEIGIEGEDASNLDFLLRKTIPSTMPFTGKFSFKLNRDDFDLKSKKLLLDGVEKLYENDSELSFQTNQHRNSIEPDSHQMEIEKFTFLISALRFARLRGHHLLNGVFAKPELNKRFRKKQPLLTTLDKSYIQLLMAVESLHFTSICEKLGDNLTNFSVGLQNIRDFFSACLKEDRTILNLIDDLDKLISTLNETTALCNDCIRKPESDWNRSTIFRTFAILFKSLENTNIGKNLTTLMDESNIVSNLSLMEHFNHNSKSKTAFDSFSRITNKIIREYFSLERNVSEFTEGSEAVKTTLEPPQTLAELIHQDLKPNLEQLLEIKDQYDHYYKSITESPNTQFSTSYERLKEAVQWLSNPPEDPNFKALLFSADDYTEVYDKVFLGASAEYTFKEHLRKWTDSMERNPFKGTQRKETVIEFSVVDLIEASETTKVEDERFNLTSVHAQLQPLFEETQQATQTYTKTLSALERRKSTPGGANSQGEAKMLREHRYTMRETYAKLINELGKESTWNQFLTFVQEVGKIANDFAKEVNEQYTGSNEASGPPKAMMIGLGQAGQQIVRAAIARMLNTTTDVRSQNMLRGLNIEWEKISKFGQLDKVAKLETERSYFQAFDQANLLAINAGAELKRMLGAPYNYIWGSPDNPELKSMSTINCNRPATNLALLDEQGKGAGNKMGKGRAYAVLADAGLEQALNRKKGSQTVTQICIVHSFAGGSGSGMVLPFLSIVKEIFPTALIWVFSAGVEYAGDDPYRAHNTTYITSDILQAHYDALHHRQKNITTRKWARFKRNQIMNNLQALNSSWSKISRYFPENLGEHNIDLNKFLSDDEKVDWEEIGSKPPLNPHYNFDDHHDIVGDCLPDGDEKVMKFTTHATDPSVSRKVELWWKKWHELAQDLGGRGLEQHLDIDKNSSSDDDNLMRTRYKITHGHIRSIAKGIELLFDKGREEALEFVAESMDMDDDTKAYIKLGIETSAPREDLENLQRDVEQYGEKMRTYHEKIESFGIQIQVMIGAREDTNIKHVIVSNSHLDLAASFYKGGESRYEIYNSVMIDVFMNLIHGLVEEVDYTDVDSLEASASSFEFMDASDLRTVTAPPIHATLIDYSNTFETNNTHGYSQAEDRKVIPNDPVYRVFKHLFSAGESPIYNSDLKGLQVEGDALSTQSLFRNFFSNKGGIRNFCPSDVIDKFEKTNLIFDEERLAVFVSELESNPEMKKYWEQSKTAPHNFGKNELLNMCNWLSLLPINLLSLIYTNEDDRKTFEDLTKEMHNAYQSLMSTDDRTSIFNELNRKNALKNHIKNLLPDASITAKTEMQNLLEDMGILTPQHLAAMPSGLFYEFAPNILAQHNLEKNIVVGTWGAKPLKDLFEFLILEKRPPPSRSLARLGTNWPGQKIWVRGDELSGQDKFDTSELHYLRIPTIPKSPDSKSAHYPYLEVNSQFMKDFTNLKIETGERHPQYNNIAFVDKIIKVASNNSEEVSRHASEIPILRQATDDLRVYSYPRNLYPDEPGISAYIRFLLFGDLQSQENSVIVDRIQDSVYTTRPSKVALTPYDGPHDFNRQTFKMKDFEMKLLSRIKSIGTLSSDGMAPGIKEIFVIFQESIEQIAEEEKPNLHDLFENLSVNFAVKNAVFNQILEQTVGPEHSEADMDIDAPIAIEVEGTNNSPTGIPLHEKIDETVLRSAIMGMHKLFSRIADLLYLTKRQHEFLKGIAKPGQGVAFNFEGTVDSVRSNPKRYLALVNNSSDISPQLVKSAVSHYYSAYMDRGQSNQPPTGKTYIQRLKSGPVANVTLLQQKAAISEIAEGFQGLMNILEQEQLEAITAPLVHPYSFLRNILWLSTMKDRWLSDPSDYYRNRLEIPADLIEPIFSQPKIIKSLITDVKTHNDMQGYALSDQDIKLWESTKNCSEALNESNRTEKFKMPLHVPDFLLIKAWQCKISEPKSLSDIENHQELLELYPKENWFEKFDHKGLLTQRYNPIEREFFTVSNKTGSSNSPFPKVPNPFESPQPLPEDTENEEKIVNPWLNALKAWMEWLGDAELNEEGQ